MLSALIANSIHPLIHGLSARWCPFVQCPLSSSLGEFLGYWDWLGYPELPPVLVFIAFSPFAFHISVFFHSLFTCHWISFVFLLYDRRICAHSINPSLADGEFPGLELARVPDIVIPEAEHGVRAKQKSYFKFLPGRGLNFRHRSLMAANVTTRLQCTPPLVASYDMPEEWRIQRDNSSPEPDANKAEDNFSDRPLTREEFSCS